MDQQEFINSISSIRPGSTFLTLKGYRNEFGEIADYSIVFHINYKNALKRSLLALESIIPETDLDAKAKKELIDSYNASLSKMETTPIEEIDDSYQRFFDEDGNYIRGIKMHRETKALHLYGFVVHKKILMPGTYPKRNKRELTIAKDKLRRLCPVNSFRQFKIVADQVNSVSVEHLSLLPPNGDINEI